MMKKFFFPVVVPFVLTCVLAIGWQARDAIARQLIETALNVSLKDVFAGSARLSNAHISRSGQIRIGRIEAVWKTPHGPFPVELGSLQLETSLVDLLAQKPGLIRFRQFRPLHSEYQGMGGKVTFWPFSKGRFEMETEVEGLGLEELEALEPSNLGGSSGKVAGQARFKIRENGAQEFQFELLSDEPGGRIQSRFFDLLTPYLPPAKYKDVLSLIGKNETVAYKKATLKIGHHEPKKINLLFKIVIPAYNLNLNLNVEIRVEEENVFSQIAQIMGGTKAENQ